MNNQEKLFWYMRYHSKCYYVKKYANKHLLETNLFKWIIEKHSLYYSFNKGRNSIIPLSEKFLENRVLINTICDILDKDLDKFILGYYKQVLNVILYECYFTDSKMMDEKSIISLIKDLDYTNPEEIFKILYDKDSKIANNIYYIDSVPEVRIVLNKEVY
jgi:hypothetical protein